MLLTNMTNSQVLHKAMLPLGCQNGFCMSSEPWGTPFCPVLFIFDSEIFK